MAKTTSAMPLEFGNRLKRLELRKTRQSKGVSLETIADSTKISIRFLRAIEEEEFEKLPGGIFNTSYLRQYAAAIDFEEAKLLAHYQKRTAGRDGEVVEAASGARGSLLRWWKTSAAAGR